MLNLRGQWKSHTGDVRCRGMDLGYRLKKLNLGVISIDVEAEAVDRKQVDCADRAESDMRTQICVGSNHNPLTS